MVKRCAWGTCNSDTRYPERLTGGINFIPFPKLGRTPDKAKRWIRLCGRPFAQLNEEILRERRKAKHLFVCSKHFVNGMPSSKYPDPISALSRSDHVTPTRPPPKPRTSYFDNAAAATNSSNKVIRVSLHEDSIEHESCQQKVYDKNTQTDDSIPKCDEEPLHMLALVSENRSIREEYARYITKTQKPQTKDKGVNTSTQPSLFSYESLQQEQFQYYTGFTYLRFNTVFKFLCPNLDLPFQPSKNLNIFSRLLLQDQLLFVLIKLRQDFDFKHLANMFGISSQDCSCLFTNWINYMFYRLGSVDIWPHRDVIIEHMPDQFKADYPSTMVIVDGTEIKIQKPSSLQKQSQCYSDYKSCTTLKGLVGIDPRGSIIYASMLFSGAISDKELTIKSNFLETLKQLISIGKLKIGDGVMADKGFTVREEIENVGLSLNIPPFVPSSVPQMSAADVTDTINIAKHRVHVERAIARVKQFKLLSNKINLSLFGCINQIWLTCCCLTNFMPFLIKNSKVKENENES